MFRHKKLDKFTYHVIGNKTKIKPFLLKWIGKEWQIDHNEFPDQQWTTKWLNLLPNMKFKLEVVDLDKINLHQDLMNYKTESYDFLEELNFRVEEMEISILQGSSIGPLIINKENLELMDGYTRYMILKKYEQKRTYAYLGLTENYKK